MPKLEKALTRGIVIDVLAVRLAVNHYLNAKHEGCVARSRGRNPFDYAQVEEVQRDNKATGWNGCMIHDSKQICRLF